MAMAEVVLGVRNISNPLSGWPRWTTSGKGATIRNARAVSRESR